MSGKSEFLRMLEIPNPNVQLGENRSHLQNADEPELSDTEEEISGRCFGYLRGQRDRALNIEFRRLKEGDSMAFPYSWLGPTRFDPSQGILMLFVGAETFGVCIRGHNLNTLLDGGLCLYDRGLLRHRITFVSEMSNEESCNPNNECVVERIQIIALQPEQTAAFLGMTE